MSTKHVQAVGAPTEHRSLVRELAGRYGIEPEKFLSTLKATAFRGDGTKEVSTEQMMALLLVAKAHNLNPWLKEIYAFPDRNNGIVPIIGIDGFIKIANEHPQFNGMTFEYDDDGQWVESIIERKDRSVPTRVREYLIECQRDTPAWRQWPRRMLRHRSIAQGVRVAFGFSGVMEQDEAEAYIDSTATEAAPKGKPRTAPPRAIESPKVEETVIESTVAAQPEPVAVKIEGDPKVALVKALDRSGVSLKGLAEHFKLEAGEISDIPAHLIPEAISWLREVGGG